MKSTIKQMLREGLENKDLNIKSYTYWEQLANMQNTIKSKGLIMSILRYAKKHGDMVTRRQKGILKRAQTGNLRPEDYHSKN